MESTPRAPIWISVLFVLSGSAMLLVALGIIAFPRESIHGPNWLLGAAALIFIFGGLAARIPRENKILQSLVGAVLFSLFGIIGSWIAFAPGERSFGGTLSIGPIALGGISPEFLGRAAFGCSAVITDLAAALLWLRCIRDFLRGE